MQWLYKAKNDDILQSIQIEVHRSKLGKNEKVM